MPARWTAYMRKHNTLADFTARLVTAAHGAGTPWMVENPADCGEVGGMAWWPSFASPPCGCTHRCGKPSPRRTRN
eukprot:1892190-Pleurochrysis_carterae.AAC.1